MVAVRINLLPKKGARQLLTEQRLRVVRRGSVVLLIVYGMVVLFMFAGRFFLARETKEVEAAVKEQEAQVRASESIESQELLVKQKLQAASRILANNPSWSRLLTQVVEFAPNEQTIKEVSLDDSGLSLTVETASLQEAAVMLQAVMTIVVEYDFVNDVVLERVEKTPSGIYGFSLKFEIRNG